MNLLLFVCSAVWSRHAYIDLDGCLLYRVPVPSDLPPKAALAYWMRAMRPMPVVRSRLVLCYVLRGLGVRLHIWTNRPRQFAFMTEKSLGQHARIFASSHHMHGEKHLLLRCGPCMDDEARHVGGWWGDYLVAPRTGR